MKQYFELQIEKHGGEKMYFLHPFDGGIELLLLLPEQLATFRGEFVKYSGIVPIFKSYHFDGISFPPTIDKI